MKTAYKYGVYPSKKRKEIPNRQISLARECSNCGNVQELPLSERICLCNRCGMQMDINASINILGRATLGQRGSRTQGESVRPQSEAVLEELRTYPANAGEANDF